MFNKLERLKNIARRQYESAMRIGNKYDCGHTLAKEISSDYATACAEFNTTMDEISQLDPNNTPRERL